MRSTFRDAIEAQEKRMAENRSRYNRLWFAWFALCGIVATALNAEMSRVVVGLLITILVLIVVRLWP